MTNPLVQVIREIEAREEFFEPLSCALCWFRPASEGAICAECIYSNHIKITEGQPEKDVI